MACGSNKEQSNENEKNYEIYYMSNNTTSIASETRSIENAETKEMILSCLQELANPPKNLSYKKVLSEDLMLDKQDIQILQNGQIILDFPKEYNNLEDLTEILSRAAIVKTLCQLQAVKEIEFYIEGNPLLDSEGMPVGFLSKDSFMEEIGE